MNWPSPCAICGYNGQGFYDPRFHACAVYDTERSALLDEIRRLKRSTDWAYTERNKLVVLLANLAIERGYPAGLYWDKTQEPEWNNVVIIDLPTGQISFHVGLRDGTSSQLETLPKYTGEWDGHTTDAKWERVREWINLMKTQRVQDGD